MRPAFVFVADANFGILPRDLEIADDARPGLPRDRISQEPVLQPGQEPSRSHGRNRPEVRRLGHRRLSHAGDPAHPSEVLACVDRSNISTEKQRQIVRRLLERDVPLEVQLIVGLPGDSPDRWKACLAELMDWGVHQEYIVFPYSLLPNAPAAELATLAKWKLALGRSRRRPPSERQAEGRDRLRAHQPNRRLDAHLFARGLGGDAGLHRLRAGAAQLLADPPDCHLSALHARRVL